MTWGQFCEAYGQRIERNNRGVRRHYEATLRLVAGFGEPADMADVTDDYAARFEAWVFGRGASRATADSFARRPHHMRRVFLAA